MSEFMGSAPKDLEVYRLCTSSNAAIFQTASAVALGNFDGVHIGHAKIIKACVEAAETYNLIPTAVTFDPHPQSILKKGHKSLIKLSTKIKLLSELGIRRVFLVSFDEEFANLGAEEFCRNYLQSTIKTKFLFTGRDFHFAHNRSGNPDYLQTHAADYGFIYHALPLVYHGQQAVSSSWIRNLLDIGAICLATKLLGRTLMISDVNEALGMVRPLSGSYLVKQHNTHGIAEISEDKIVLHGVPYNESLELVSLIHPKRQFNNTKQHAIQMKQNLQNVEAANKFLSAK